MERRSLPLASVSIALLVGGCALQSPTTGPSPALEEEHEQAPDGGSADACVAGVERGCVAPESALEGAQSATSDSELAAEYRRQGCDAGDMEDCRVYGGQLVLTARSQPQRDRGAALLRRSCYSGLGRACTELGAFAVSATGLGMEGPAVADLLALGCTYGDPRGCTGAGMIYQEGRG